MQECGCASCQVDDVPPAYSPGLRPLRRGRRGESSCSTPCIAPSTPGEGEARRRGEEGSAGGGVDDRLGCWITALLPPPPRLGGGRNEPRWGQGAPPHYERGGLHAVVVSSELMVVSSELSGG